MPPRFTFVTRRTFVPHSAPVWPGAWTLSSDGAAPKGGWTAWRLIGSNNRELGRSFSVFDDAEQCLAALERFRASAQSGVPLVSADPRNGSWGWRFDLGNRPAAASGRSYRRQRECVYNLEKFTEALVTAVVSAPAVAHLKADAS
ncbi:MAG TPA: hypothetical protein VEV13_02820 [Candidatus Limnocylindria bacterium]|nr:hypothetical protein [Candidatus Limnocylindria bacterium]